MNFKITAALSVFGLLFGCSSSPSSPRATPTSPKSENLCLDYSAVGNWGQPVNGLRCRLAIRKPTIRSDERLSFRLDLQNVSTSPINIVVESRGWFGWVMIDGANKMGWAPPAGKFRNACRALKPDEIISTSDFAAIHQVPIAEGKHVFTGEYSNTVEISDKHFDGWMGTAVKLWTGTDDVHMAESGPVEIMIESEMQ